MDSDFFAAPGAPAAPVAPRPTVGVPAYRPLPPTKPNGSFPLGGVVAGVVLIAAAATAVAVMVGGGLAHHEAKTLDSRSLAYDATTQSDLTQVAMKEQAYFAEKGQYGGAQEIGSSVLPGRSGTQITVMYDDSSFCLQGAHLGTNNVYYYSSAGGLLPLGQTCS